MKYIVVVPDGMADQPLPELGEKTPLEAANTTNMDYVASVGTSGLIQTIPDGMKPGSDIGNMALLGYNPAKHYTGRAPLEAANLDITLEENEVAFRCNFVTIMDQKMHDYSAGHISTKEAKLLIAELNKHLATEEIQFYTGKSYRHLMVIRVRNVDIYTNIECTPPHDILGKDIKPFLPQGTESQMLLKLIDESRTILANHSVNQVKEDLKENPANMIWLWGQGTKPALPSFTKKFGVNGAIISAVDLVNGIGKLAGLEVIDVPGATGYYDTNYKGKADHALKALETHDFVFIHIEAPDEAGHNGDAKAKLESIEKIDRDIVGTILNHFGQGDDYRILILPDHPTPVALRTHTSDPVCFAMAGKGIEKDASNTLGESAASEEGLKFNSGEELMNQFMRNA